MHNERQVALTPFSVKEASVGTQTCILACTHGVNSNQHR